MERFTWPKNLSSSRKRTIQNLLPAQNPTKKLTNLFDAHSQTSNDTGQPPFVDHPVANVLGSVSNTLSLSSSDQFNEVVQVPSNACVRSEVSEGSESINTPLPRKTSNIRTRLDQNLIDGGHQRGTSDQKSILNSKLPSRFLEESESINTPVQRSPVSWSRQSLMEAATAISEDRADVAWEILTRLSAMPNPVVFYSEQKLMEYMLSALKSRVSPIDNPPPVAELFTEDHLLSAQSLYERSPCFTLGFMAANLAILEAASEQPSTNKLHLIEFDIGLEEQYRDLLCELFRRQAGNQSTLKITTLADSFNGEERLRMVGNRLSKLAAIMGVRLVFNVVSQKLSELSRDSLGCEPNEVLAVNLSFKLYRVPDESVSVENPRNELLRRVKGLAPQVVMLVEQEMNGNTAPFMVRVEEALAYYGALLASLQPEFWWAELKRVRAEEGLSRRLRNTVACEGVERVERCEVFGKWRARMEMAGFELKPLGQELAEATKPRLSSYWLSRGCTVKEENGGVCLGWGGRTLTVASAWH
ncbi:hypothetical protein BT93_A0447 [Corymbia citriodora subsp. variegata]|nr:hypothetical protein BT93_A0447 [Corymbia citriodora subsp. variegata]KAF8041854.1 hypothetical protein BT93_A0447 [Corymbia citriodora subsp. variegata]